MFGTPEEQYASASEAYHRLTARASVEGWTVPSFDAFHARHEAYASGLDTMHTVFRPILALA